ncbi:MAG: FRG domain-containing protein [Bacteroidales bacterium]|nr:FRG domain-containing protein [Candidatus Liminaster caballi]
MILPTYNCLQEKRDIFGDRYRCIDKWTDLEELLSCDSEGLLFRGMCEAKYKNYTSVQRYYITNDFENTGIEIKQIIQKEVESLLSSDSNLKSYYEALGIEPNWFLLNSFLQHYGGATPLLDFSHNPLVALYFMQNEIIDSSEGKEDIGNYSSLYYIKEDDIECINSLVENASGKLVKGTKKYCDKIKSIDKETFNKISQFSQDAVTDQMRQSARNLIESFFSNAFYNSFEDMVPYLEKEEASLLLSDNVLSLDYPEIGCSKRIVTTTNLNSIAQKGIFVLRGGTNPLEGKYVHCFDIHKSFIPTIRERLKENNITKENLFPQEELIAKQAFELSVASNIKLH